MDRFLPGSSGAGSQTARPAGVCRRWPTPCTPTATMLVESALSWDNEREVTALDWPPVLTPQLEETPHPGAPRNAVTAGADAGAEIGFSEDGISIPADPDLTEAELRATSIDSM